LRAAEGVLPMTTDPLDNLLAKLQSGDLDAARYICCTFEPYLRLVVRRSLPRTLRTKFDSLDVVQSIWMDVLKGFREGRWQFATLDQLKAFLVKVTRNRLIDHYRHVRHDLRHQRPLEAMGQKCIPSAGPAEIAEANELWEQMLETCPTRHHELLELRRQGHTLTEIAERTGLHESSVRRILYELARGLVAT
jgi:RNA polymerase sigma factor (sigma-70 family)